MRRSSLSSSLLLTALLLLVVGCRDVPSRWAARLREREWSALLAEHHVVASERADVRALRARVLELPVKADGTPESAAGQQLAAELASREQAVGARSARLEDRLVRFVAGFRVRAGEPRRPALAAAIHLKSDEDAAVAQDWIERGGEYGRAVDILERAQRADPGYPALARALARAREMQQVSRERFAAVVPGMSRAQVRGLLGPVNLGGVVARPAEHVEAWFYPRAGGGTAGVYFRYDARRRAFVVYAADFAAGRGERAAAAQPAG